MRNVARLPKQAPMTTTSSSPPLPSAESKDASGEFGGDDGDSVCNIVRDMYMDSNHDSDDVDGHDDRKPAAESMTLVKPQPATQEMDAKRSGGTSIASTPIRAAAASVAVGVGVGIGTANKQLEHVAPQQRRHTAHDRNSRKSRAAPTSPGLTMTKPLPPASTANRVAASPSTMGTHEKCLQLNSTSTAINRNRSSIDQKRLYSGSSDTNVVVELAPTKRVTRSSSSFTSMIAGADLPSFSTSTAALSRPGAFRQHGIDYAPEDSADEYDEHGNHEHDSMTHATYQSDTAQHSQSEENGTTSFIEYANAADRESSTHFASRTSASGLISAQPVSDTEKIYEAADIKRDYTRRKYLLIVVGGILSLAVILSVTLVIMLRPKPSDDQENIDPRCVARPIAQLPIPFQCLCTNTTEATWMQLNETGKEHYERLDAFLRLRGIVDIDLDLNKTGCQFEHQVILFMAVEINNRVGFETYGYSRTKAVMQIFALCMFFLEMRGVDWISYDKWMEPNSNICEWHGLGCPFLASVDRLLLPDNNLRGTLSGNLQHAHALRQIDLSGNTGIVGSIPTEIGTMTTSLLDLSIGECSLSGSLPTQLGQLTRLDSLTLSNNKLSGSIPPELFGMSNLRMLQLTNNSLEGTIPESISDLTRLISLEVDINQLTGMLPTTLGAISTLEILNIAVNKFNSTLPPNLILPSRLTFFNVYKSGVDQFFLPSLCDESLPHPAKRQVWLECNDLKAEDVCECCFFEGDPEASIFIGCGEFIPEYSEF
mmetsp:Transcript_16765/g.46958  ORF Transcript_16765/g.46958 Transcript_16765/m.46958 type:complete len:768 (+) Transcript_16765:1-2304(+)